MYWQNTQVSVLSLVGHILTTRLKRVCYTLQRMALTIFATLSSVAQKTYNNSCLSENH